MALSEQTALEEFKLQTSLSPLKFYLSNKNPQSSTLIMAVPEDQAQAVPKWIYLFGKNVQTKHKPFRTRIEQCTRCWDYHSRWTCSPTTRCCICSERDCTEDTHSPPDEEEASDSCCTNCCGLFLAEHSIVPSDLPYNRESSRSFSRPQLISIRRVGARQHMLKDQTDTTETPGNLGFPLTREQSQSC